MRTYDGLSSEKKAQARKYFEAEILNDICNGDYDKLGNEFYEAIKQCFMAAGKMATPWFVSRYILNDNELVAEISEQAKEMAERYKYLEEDEIDCIPLSFLKD